jgi:hypothetical protein
MQTFANLAVRVVNLLPRNPSGAYPASPHCAFLGLLVQFSRGEALLQYFNTSWSEVANKMPELVEAGYTALWMPPPTKGSGGHSVGYDLWNSFDLGSKDHCLKSPTRRSNQDASIECSFRRFRDELDQVLAGFF